MLKKSDFPSGANQGPVSSASFGAEATRITLPASITVAWDYE